VRRSFTPVVITALVLVFFYLPVAVLVLNSFNASRFGGEWGGFTLDWYRRLWRAREIWQALGNTLLIATVSTAIATVLGTTAAFALDRYRSRLQDVHYLLVYAPLVVPEILMGMSLLLFFVALRLQLGYLTIVVSHVTFCVSYVTMVVLGRLQDFDWGLVEAAQDLGAGAWCCRYWPRGSPPGRCWRSRSRWTTSSSPSSWRGPARPRCRCASTA
jgi:spermidine/putrescine transport system permease protein